MFYSSYLRSVFIESVVTYSILRLDPQLLLIKHYNLRLIVSLLVGWIQYLVDCIQLIFNMSFVSLGCGHIHQSTKPSRIVFESLGSPFRHPLTMSSVVLIICWLCYQSIVLFYYDWYLESGLSHLLIVSSTNYVINCLNYHQSAGQKLSYLTFEFKHIFAFNQLDFKQRWIGHKSWSPKQFSWLFTITSWLDPKTFIS